MHQLTGISLSPAHKERVRRRLARRLWALNFADFDAYLGTLQAAGDSREQANFVNALTTNLTAFFRDPTHFDFFGATVLGQALQDDRTPRRLRFWSAGCSTGEEAYSLASLVAGVLQAHPRWDAEILATDLDSGAIEVASRGEYPVQSVPGMPAQERARLFAPVQSDTPGQLRVRPGVRRLVCFRQMNLLGDWPAMPCFDAIFCRNVMIYFDAATRRVLLDRFADRLAPGGYLFIGCSESIRGLSGRFARVDKAVYRKRR